MATGQWPPQGSLRGVLMVQKLTGDYEEVSDLPACGGREEESEEGRTGKEKVGGGNAQ